MTNPSNVVHGWGSPALMMVGFADHPDDFTANELAFYSLLSRLSFVDDDGTPQSPSPVGPPNSASEGAFDGEDQPNEGAREDRTPPSP
jgi:hypothetical protein